MSRQRRVLVNALSSTGQVAANGILLFVLYRYLIRTIGPEAFGVWSVVLAATSVSSVGALGLAGGAVKFVSQYLARGEHGYVGRLIQTAILSSGLAIGVLLALVYPLLRVLLDLIIPEAYLGEAYALLPYAVFSFWALATGQVILSCLDGCHRIDMRSMLVIGSVVLYLSLVFALVPRYGLIGLARAQVVQHGMLMLGGWLLLRRVHAALPLVPHRWDRGAFREMIGYSLRFQVISVTVMLLEPATKALLSRFGSLSAVSYFEMANKLASQLRSLVATAHRSVVPAIADLQERSPGRIRTVYVQSSHLIGYILVACLPILLVLLPVISRLWIGTYEPTLVSFGWLLLGAWFLNLLANPAYFANMGTGELRWNVRGHLIIAGLNVGLGLILGYVQGAHGVVAGFATALVAGSLAIIVAYQRRYGVSWSTVVQRESYVLGLLAAIGAGGAALLYAYLSEAWSAGSLLVAMSGVYLLITFPAIWRHPARREIQAWVRLLFKPHVSPSTSEV